MQSFQRCSVFKCILSLFYQAISFGFFLSLKLNRWVVCMSAVNSHMLKTRRMERSNANGRLDGNVCLYKKYPTFLIHSPIHRHIEVQH